MAGDSGQDRCVGCGLSYNRDERCPRTLICGHTSCTSCLDTLIQEGQRRCPTCRKPFFSLSCVLIPKNSEVLKRLGESSKSSSYSSPLKLKSSLSLDSRARLSSSRVEDSFDIGASMRPKSEGGEGRLSTASTGVSLPPPMPASAPPSLDDTSNDPQVQIRSQGESMSGGGGGGGGSRLYTSERSYSVDEAARRTYTTPSFPTIRTRLNTTTGRMTDSDTTTTTTTTTSKQVLRSAKSLPPPSSSSSPFKSLPTLSPSFNTSTETSSSSASPSGYTSPFLKTSSSSSSFSTSTFRKLSTSLDSPSGDSDGTHQTPSSFTDSVDSAGLSRSMSSLHKLDTKLSVSSAGRKQDGGGLGLSKWKLDTPTSLSRKGYTDSLDHASINTHAASSYTKGQSEASRQNAQAKRPSRGSGTPTHVLGVCRSITSKTRPAADHEAELTNKTENSYTSSSSYQGAASSSSFFSSSASSITASKDSHNHQASSYTGLNGTDATRESQMMGLREAGAPDASPDVPPAEDTRDGHTHAFTQHSSLGSRDDGGDASWGRPSRAGVLGGMKVQCDEAGDASRHSLPASSSSEAGGEKSKESRKLGVSASLSARLGARTRFLSKAIDEENEENTGASEASEVHSEIRKGRDVKLYKPDRQSEQPSRPRGSLGARISARAGYLSRGESGGGGEASRGGVQAEDSTKIDLQRRAGRTVTKREAAAGEHHQTSPDQAAVSSVSHLDNQHLGSSGGSEAGQARTNTTPMNAPPAHTPWHSVRAVAGTTHHDGEAGVEARAEAGAEAGGEAGGAGTRLWSSDGVLQSSTLAPSVVGGEGGSREASRHRRSKDVLSVDASSPHELSQHSRPRHHQMIDSRAKEELSEPGCAPQAASTRGVHNTYPSTPDPGAGRASGHRIHPGEGSSTPEPRGGIDPHTASRGDAHRWTKHNQNRDAASPVFRSGTGNTNVVPDAVDGSSETSGAVLGRETGPIQPQSQPPSNLFPWKKKWKSVTERTSFAATRHTGDEAHNTPLNSASKQPDHTNPEHRSFAPSGEGSRGANTRVNHSLSTQHSGPAKGSLGDGHSARPFRGSLGALSIGRVPSLEHDDTDTGTDEEETHPTHQDQTHQTPSGNTYSRDRNEGIHTDGEAREGGGRTDVRNASVLRGNERMSAWLSSLGDHEGEHSLQTPDAAQHTWQVPRGAAVHTGHLQDSTSDAAGETKEDLNARLRQARMRLRGASTTPTEEDLPPPRTNLTYLLTRLQNTERKKASHADEDEDEDEVFDESSESEEEANTHQQTLSSTSSSRKTSVKGTEHSRTSTTSRVVEGDDHEETTDEPDSVTRRFHQHPHTHQHQHTQLTPHTQHQDHTQDSDEDCIDAPDVTSSEYEPGVGLCSSHGLMLHLFCQDCEEWVCDACLPLLHRPPPQGSCHVITAAEGVKQMKVTHESFLTSKNNTLDYFQAELQRIVEECDNSIALHGDNLHRLEESIEEEQKLLRGIESMRSLAKDKLSQVYYWEDVLQENLSRIDESSSSSDVINAVRDSSKDILQKAMKAVSVEAGAGLLLSPPNSYD